MTGLVGRELAIAVHPICRGSDPDQAGLVIAELEATVIDAGIEIGGSDTRQVLGTAVNQAQDLFEWMPGGRWRWIEPVVLKGAPLSGITLAEEAYRLAIVHDPNRVGLHYERIKQLLIDDGVIVRGPNQGKTVFTALKNASKWFEWVSSGTFTWKIGGGEG